jgi:hypothetical protein
MVCLDDGSADLTRYWKRAGDVTDNTPKDGRRYSYKRGRELIKYAHVWLTTEDIKNNEALIPNARNIYERRHKALWHIAHDSQIVNDHARVGADLSPAQTNWLVIKGYVKREKLSRNRYILNVTRDGFKAACEMFGHWGNRAILEKYFTSKEI